MEYGRYLGIIFLVHLLVVNVAVTQEGPDAAAPAAVLSGGAERRYACWGGFGPPVVSVQCPRGTVIDVLRAGLKVQQSSGRCVYRESDCGCELGARGCNMPDVRRLCVGRSACRLDVTQQYISTLHCKGFSHYMFVDFNCVKAESQRNLDTDICTNSVLHQSSGFLHSPRYPHRYPASQRCECRLTAAGAGSSVMLEVRRLQLHDHRCEQDRLRVAYAGQSVDLCGGHESTLPRIIDAHTNHVTVTFSTDDSGSASGFWMKYNAVPTSVITVNCTSETLAASTIPTDPIADELIRQHAQLIKLQNAQNTMVPHDQDTRREDSPHVLHDQANIPDKEQQQGRDQLTISLNEQRILQNQLMNPQNPHAVLQDPVDKTDVNEESAGKLRSFPNEPDPSSINLSIKEEHKLDTFGAIIQDDLDIMGKGPQHIDTFGLPTESPFANVRPHLTAVGPRTLVDLTKFDFLLGTNVHEATVEQLSSAEAFLDHLITEHAVAEHKGPLHRSKAVRLLNNDVKSSDNRDNMNTTAQMTNATEGQSEFEAKLYPNLRGLGKQLRLRKLPKIEFGERKMEKDDKPTILNDYSHEEPQPILQDDVRSREMVVETTTPWWWRFSVRTTTPSPRKPPMERTTTPSIPSLPKPPNDEFYYYSDYANYLDEAYADYDKFRPDMPHAEAFRSDIGSAEAPSQEFPFDKGRVNKPPSDTTGNKKALSAEQLKKLKVIRAQINIIKQQLKEGTGPRQESNEAGGNRPGFSPIMPNIPPQAGPTLSPIFKNPVEQQNQPVRPAYEFPNTFGRAQAPPAGGPNSPQNNFNMNNQQNMYMNNGNGNPNVGNTGYPVNNYMNQQPNQAGLYPQMPVQSANNMYTGYGNYQNYPTQNGYGNAYPKPAVTNVGFGNQNYGGYMNNQGQAVPNPYGNMYSNQDMQPNMNMQPPQNVQPSSPNMQQPADQKLQLENTLSNKISEILSNKFKNFNGFAVGTDSETITPSEKEDNDDYENVDEVDDNEESNDDTKRKRIRIKKIKKIKRIKSETTTEIPEPTTTMRPETFGSVYMGGSPSKSRENAKMQGESATLDRGQFKEDRYNPDSFVDRMGFQEIDRMEKTRTERERMRGVYAGAVPPAVDPENDWASRMRAVDGFQGATNGHTFPGGGAADTTGRGWNTQESVNHGVPGSGDTVITTVHSLQKDHVAAQEGVNGEQWDGSDGSALEGDPLTVADELPADDLTVAMVAGAVVSVIVVIVILAAVIRSITARRERQNAMRQRHKRECDIRRKMQARKAGLSVPVK